LTPRESARGHLADRADRWYNAAIAVRGTLLVSQTVARVVSSPRDRAEIVAKKKKKKKDGPQNTVLVVEDDLTLLETLEYNLAAEGYEIITAADGLTALEIAREEQPDLIVLDLMLPGLDGFEVCRILRQEMNVPILMLTARADEVDRVVGLEMGADDYLTKPFSMRELLARVRLIREELVEERDRAGSEQIAFGDLAVDLERTADQVINICERVVFTVTGALAELDTDDWGLESLHRNARNPRIFPASLRHLPPVSPLPSWGRGTSVVQSWSCWHLLV
jgi:CheY-like chemotaxis protein